MHSLHVYLSPLKRKKRESWNLSISAPTVSFFRCTPDLSNYTEPKLSTFVSWYKCLVKKNKKMLVQVNIHSIYIHLYILHNIFFIFLKNKILLLLLKHIKIKDYLILKIKNITLCWYIDRRLPFNKIILSWRMK